MDSQGEEKLGQAERLKRVRLVILLVVSLGSD